MFEYEFDKYCDNIRDLQALYCHNDGEYRKLGKEELFEVMRYIYDRTWENKFK